nr:hypothetical protein [Tanacetum cinerariifolium]
MSTSANSSVEQVSRGADVVVTKQRLAFVVNQEIMEDALRVEDYKRMASQLVLGGSVYILLLGSLVLMEKETEMKIGEKIAYVSSLGNDAVV